MKTTTSRLRTVYRGDALRAVAMPLGGIGTGSIALCGDGSLRQWQIHNQVNHLACVPGSFFAVWTRRASPPGQPVARVLQSAALYETSGPLPPPTSNDHIVPLAHKQLLSKLPGVRSIEFVGEYPIAELTYHDEELPLQVRMEAFNPFIPLESKDSALPVIIFNFTVSNPNTYSVMASVAASLQNAVGWDGVTPISGTSCPLYGGNFNTLYRAGKLSAINMMTAHLPEYDERWGNMVLAVLSPHATYLTQWDDLDAFWADFSSDGRFGNLTDSTPSRSGHTWNGALAVPFVLEPGASKELTFLIAWYFPNHYVNYSQRPFFGLEDERSRFWIGHQYSNWFRSAMDVADYVSAHLERLTGQTRLARDTFYDTTLPRVLIDTVTSQMSIIRTPTCFWAQDGRFFGFEGCSGASTPHKEPIGGCCPLNCTHVWNYEMALSRLFPDLERTMRDTEWRIQQHPSGYLPHRVLLPLYLPRPWDREIGGPEHPALDGLLGAILKTLREYRASGDAAWLAQIWPSVKRALNYVWTAHDPGHTGVIEGEQPNTYDISIYGANTFIGTLYLAALRAAEEMAKLLGEDDLAAECRRVFENGRAALEQRLWNGEYYIQEVDLEKHPKYNWGHGCHADQLLGQWWAHYLGLGHILDPDHVRTAARSIVKYNFRRDFREHDQQPRAFVTAEDQGLLNCTWPKGGRPAVPTLYSDEVWTGIEYEIAGLLLYEGEPELALQLLEATRSRYDGRKQNPWNDIECGDHYVRAMASWALLEAASGYHYDAGAGEIGFAPVLMPEEFRAPFIARDGWGIFTQKVSDNVQEATIAAMYGWVECARLRLRPRGKVQAVAVALGGVPINVTWQQRDGDIVLTLSETAKVEASEELTVTMSLCA